ncbi:MAG: 2-oxo acid dehydrogenase subunit E2 [Actinobacteria bacterium]|nr:2-oxo acid dehydrogenase subunit E2 [Actinomycetota bacterium]
MATEFIMPKLGLTMEEGTILEWLVEDGTAITPGMAVLRIETDKVESDVESPTAGILHRTAGVGDTFACGATIGFLLADGEQPPTVTTPGNSAPAVAPVTPPLATPTVARTSSDGRAFVSPNAKRVARELGIDVATVVGTGPNGRVVAADVHNAHQNPGARRAPATALSTVVPIVSSNGQVLATAAARQLAELLGVDLSLVPYDPTDGRVTRDGVAAYVRARLATSSASVATSPVTKSALAPATQTPTSVKKISGMRGTIAKRMNSSLQEMAQLTLHMDADLDAVVADRETRKAEGGATLPGFTDYVIAACARALRLHPIVNSQVTDDGIALLPDVHVSMAVALDEGLIVPVIKNTLSLDLPALADQTKRLSTAAREGKLTLAELEGGTFSVSTLGMFGVDGFTPIVNPPNTAILGVGRLRDDVVLGAKGKPTTVKRMTLSLTWDHRVFDGAPAAQFCKSIVDLLSDPAALNATH